MIDEGVEVETLRIVVAGGGLAGLATALILQQSGIKNVTVYERDRDFDDRRQGYGLTLTRNLHGPLAKLGILEECMSKNCTSNCHWVFNPDGDIKGYFGRAFDGEDDKTKEKAEQGGSLGNLRIPRQELRRMLLDRLGTGTVVWGHKLYDYEETDDKVKAVFVDSFTSIEDDGDEDALSNPNCVECDILVGADGLRSRVRQLRDRKKFVEKKRKSKLSGNYNESPTPLKYLGVSVIIGISSACHPLLTKQGFYVLDGVHRLFTMPFSEATDESPPLHMWQLSFSGWSEEEFRQKLLSRDTLSEKCEGCTTRRGLTEPDMGKRLLAEAARRTKDWMAPVEQLVTNTRPEDVWGTPLYDRDPMWLLDTGASGSIPGSRVTVVGDASHPMSMFKGQGCNQALEDGPLLAYWLRGGPSAAKTASGKLSRKVLLTRLRNFERQMVARSSIKQRDSRAAAKRLHGLELVAEEGSGTSSSSTKFVDFGFEGVAKEYRRMKKAGAGGSGYGRECSKSESEDVVACLLRTLQERRIGASDAEEIEAKVAQCIEGLRESRLD